MIACVFRCFFMLRIARGNMECDMGAGGKRILLDLIGDPEEGIALLCKDPPNETPEQRKLRKFWLFQFECWRNWRAGDSVAYVRAVMSCYTDRRPPPRWVKDASIEFIERGISGQERKGQ